MLDVMEKTRQEVEKIKNADATVVNVYMGWQNARMHYSRRLNRCIENWRMYGGLDNDIGLGQWSPQAAAYMIALRRQILTYNFCKPIVDTLAGSLMQMAFDPEWYPVNSEINSLTEAIKKAAYVDKEVCDWNVAYKDLVDGGLIFESVAKIVINDEFDPLGNIGLETCLPGSVIPLPMWRTSRSKDCKKCWHEQWLMADTIVDTWKEKALLLAADAETIKRFGAQYGPHGGVTPFWTASSDTNTWGDAHRIISEYSIEPRKVTRVSVLTDNGEIFVPPSIKKTEEIIDYLNSQLGQDGWDPNYVLETPSKENVCVVRRICPSISWSSLIEFGESEIRTGRLPFLWWSASRINGEPHGIIDSVKDTQSNINYLNSLITHKMQVEGGGGSQFIDRSKFANDDEFDRYRTSRNDPTETFEVIDNALDNGRLPATPTQNSQFPKEAYEHLNHLIATVLPKISKVTPASMGETENPNQSGYLYKLMKTQTDVQSYTIYFSLRQFWNEFYESYLLQVPYTYGNEMIQRTFNSPGIDEPVILNERVTLPDGRTGIKNDVRLLHNIRLKVIVSEGQQSVTKNLEDLQIIGDYSKQIPKEKAAYIHYLINAQSQKIDSLSEEDKQALQIIGEKELELAMLSLESNALQAKLNNYQLQQQLAIAEGRVAASPANGTIPPGGQSNPPNQTPQLPDNSTPPQGGFNPIPQATGPQAQGVAV